MQRPEFPRSNKYDHQWMLDNQMGPNAVWLVEWLSEILDLKPGMRVLDLGCGKAMTSIFVAKEFDVRVWATDLWIGPDHNWTRVLQAGVQDSVFPMRCEAHNLPFPAGFFDAVISVDAFQYFGTADLYLSYLASFVRAGGEIGIVVPGLTRETETVPAYLSEPQANGKVFWEDDCACFHTAQWWQKHWESTGAVAEVTTDLQIDGWRHWRDFERAAELAGKSIFPSDAEALDRDRGETLGLVRAKCHRTEKKTTNLQNPAVGVDFGVDVSPLPG